jgi:hypothetical protein
MVEVAKDDWRAAVVEERASTLVPRAERVESLLMSEDAISVRDMDMLAID